MSEATRVQVSTEARTESFWWPLLWPALVFAALVGLALVVDRPVSDLAKPANGSALYHVIDWYIRPIGQSPYHVFIILVVFAIGFAAWDRRLLNFSLVAAVACGATGGIVVPILKQLAGRARPREVPFFGEGFHGPHLTRYMHSFPSGDAAMIFCFAYVVGHYVPVLRWPLYGLAALIAFGRVYMLAHYTSDVIVGAGIGLGLGWLAVRLLATPRSSGAEGQAAQSA